MLTEEEYSLLITQNRKQYCVPIEEIDAMIERDSSVLDQEEPDAYPTNKEPEERSEGAPAVNAANKEVVHREPEKKVEPKQTKVRPTPPDPYLAGQGGREHKYLQQLIKQAAQDRGHMAIIEQQVLNGAGSVDVALTKEEKSIAVEISVTTKPEHEFGNVKKCLNAGFERVFLISSNKRHLGKLKKYIEPLLNTEQIGQVHCAAPDEFIAYLDSLGAEDANSETTIRGYKVKVKHTTVDLEDTVRRREAIAGVISKSVKRTKGQ